MSIDDAYNDKGELDAFWESEALGEHVLVKGERILDSGTRRDFGTGAVRDMAEGKGRMDLLPWDVLEGWVDDGESDATEMFLFNMRMAMEGPGRALTISAAVTNFIEIAFDGNVHTAILEYACHMEAGCKKYGDRNWESGIPVMVYLDSAMRHYIKWARGDTDERHDRAVLWNLWCCLWTIKHKPEMIYAPVGGVK